MPSTSIIDLYNKSLKEVGFKGAVVHTRDLTPYYSEGNSGKDAKLVDEKAISALEEKLSTKRYGQGMGVWGKG